MRTLIRFFEESTEKFGDHVYMWEKKDGAFRESTYKEIRADVHRFAAGLIALGIEKGDRISLLAKGTTYG